MANIEVKGYANKPSNKTNDRGVIGKFTLAERVKQQDGTYKRAYYNVTVFNREAPADGSFVTVKGYMKVREYEKDGQKRQSLDVVAQELDVSPPREKQPGPAEDLPDPFEA